MADYKLRLEVDVKELEKQLLSIAKAFNAKIGGGANNAGPFSEKAVKNGQEQIKLISEMTQAMAKEVDISAKMFKMQSELLKQRHKERLEEQKIVELRQLRVGLLKQETAKIRAAGSRESAFKSIGGLFGKPFGMGSAGSAAGAGIDMIIANLTKRKRLKEIDRKEGVKQARLDLLSTTKPSSYEELGKRRDTTSRTGWGAYSKGMQASPLGGLANIIPKQSEESKKQTNKLLGFFRGKGTDSKAAVTRDTSKFGRLTDYMKKASRTFDKKTGMGKGVSKFGAAAGTPIKIAGIASGLLAGSGIGKMLIDSSPLLQSMMKLLNVGIMMILRPIGDFIGFMLRPLLIEFVKRVAVPMYKQGFQVAKKYGTQLGKMLVDMFTKPEEFLRKAIVNPFLLTMGEWYINIWRGIEKMGSSILNFFNPDDAYKKAELQKIDIAKDAEIQKLRSQYETYGNQIGMSPEMQSFKDFDFDESIAATKAQTDATTQVVDQLPVWSGTIEYAMNNLQNITCVNTGATGTNTDSIGLNTEAVIAQTEQAKANQTLMEQWMEIQREAQQAAEQEYNMRGSCLVHDYAATEISPSTGKPVDAWKGAKERVTEAKLRAEAEKAGRIYGTNYANPDFAWDGRSSSERIAEAEAKKVKTSPIMEAARKSIEGYTAKSIVQQNEARRHTGYGSGGAYNPSLRNDPISSGAINARTGRPWSARDIMSGRGGINSMTIANPFFGRGSLTQPGFKIHGDPSNFIGPMQGLQRGSGGNSNGIWNARFQKNDDEKYKETKETAEKINKHRQEELVFSQNSRFSMEGIRDSFGIMEEEVDNARIYGSKIAEGFSQLWDKVQKALNKMAVQRTQAGKLTSAARNARVARSILKNETNVVDTKARYKLTYPSGETRILELDDQALAYYNKLRSQGTGPLSIIKMARGGIINEPILGFGQRTGRQYMMGENGPETVTPGVNTKPGTTNSPTFNITINASNIGDIERQLKPAVLKMLKESTARAGIV